MVKLYKQISFADTFEECKDVFQNNKPKFLKLLSQHLDLSSLIPQDFYWSYHKTLGRDRKYSLSSMLSALVLQKILGIPTVSLLIIFLNLCHEAREFCGLPDVPHNSQFTRFKQDFVIYLENFFNHLVDITEPICQEINTTLASTIAYDTSGIETFVTENNPKFINSIIKKLKAFYKDKPDVDVYKMAYSLMPSSASSKQRNQATLHKRLLLLCLQVWHYHQRPRHSKTYCLFG
ncbi:transposase, partial [Acetivibrio cellulolyticus]|uniref:transposase n=1 Tax=Acetivibrio cellulolyticus TaxID=35830 RepID=UPI0002481C9D